MSLNILVPLKLFETPHKASSHLNFERPGGVQVGPVHHHHLILLRHLAQGLGELHGEHGVVEHGEEWVLRLLLPFLLPTGSITAQACEIIIQERRFLTNLYLFIIAYTGYLLYYFSTNY